MDLEDPEYTVVMIMTNGVNHWEDLITSSTVRERQVIQNILVFLDATVMMRSIGIGVIAVTVIGTTKV